MWVCWVWEVNIIECVVWVCIVGEIYTSKCIMWVCSYVVMGISEFEKTAT